MAKNYVYFDLETIHSANDVGGWNNKGDMRMSVGVTYSSKSNGYIAYPENKVEELIKELTSADLVIGFNHINFDYPVLEGYHPFSLADQCISLDLMVSIEEKIGHRIKLDSVASATLGAGKTAQGLDAIRWWRYHSPCPKSEPYQMNTCLCLPPRLLHVPTTDFPSGDRS